MCHILPPPFHNGQKFHQVAKYASVSFPQKP
jgi:hypothetical protein